MIHTYTYHNIYYNTCHKKAFTIMELLVVILIMGTIMTIGFGSMMSSSTRNSTIATQRLIHSYIQQARQRSIAQGESIVVNIHKDSNTISGISKIHFIDESFEWDGSSSAGITAINEKLDSSTQISDLTFFMPFGSSGYGWYDPALMLKAMKDTHQRPLLTKSSDGFRMSCSVKAPPASNGPDRIPLLLLVPENGDDRFNEAYAGLELWRVPQFIFDAQMGRDVFIGYAWIPMAWIGTETRPTWPTATFSNPPLQADWPVSGVIPNDITPEMFKLSNPYTGDQWTQLSLLYDGRNLTLYRDGKEIEHLEIENLEDDESNLAINDKVELFVGRCSYGSNPSNISAASIDNVSLTRTGSGQVSDLGTDIRALHDYQIIAHNGNIVVYKLDLGTGSDLTPGDLEFVSTEFDKETENTLTFTLGANGSIQSTIAGSEEEEGEK